MNLTLDDVINLHDVINLLEGAANLAEQMGWLTYVLLASVVFAIYIIPRNWNGSEEHRQYWTTESIEELEEIGARMREAISGKKDTLL